MIEPSAAVIDAVEAESRALSQRAERLCTGLRRAGLQLVATDAVVAVLIAADGPVASALAWFVVFQILQWLRRRHALRYLASSQRAPAALFDSMVRWWALLGVGRAVAIAIVFVQGSANTQVLLTMITVGLGAASVATSGDDVRLMRAWSIPALGALALAWAAQLTWQGAALALLVAFLGRLLVVYVALGAEQSRRLIDHSVQLEHERDRVHAANVALERIGAELRAERDRAAEANAAKTRVLASVSHDLRQPLFALSLNTAALGDLLEASDDMQLKRVESGLRRGLEQCRGLLDQLVDFSRLESGSVEVRWQPVEVGPFLQALAATYEPAARAAGLQWRLELDRLPRFAWTDPQLLERLVGNLLQNAVKFTLHGHVGLRITHGEPRIGIEVFDSGPGIPADQQQRVFEEFYQLDNPSRDRARGIGLGLSIVKRLAELLGVGLQLHSDGAQGCRFSLDLPASRGASAPTVPSPAHSARSLTLDDRAPVVLAVDDEPELLADLQTLLGGRGYLVLTATDAADACAAAARQRPDLVLADWRLRDGKTGLDAVRAVRQLLGSEVPALIVTGDTAPHRIAEATASGLRVLHKPVDGQALLLALQQALDVPRSSAVRSATGDA